MPKPPSPPEENPFITVDEDGNYTINTIDGDEGSKGDLVKLDLSDQSTDQDVTITGSESGDMIHVFTGSGNDTIRIGDGEGDVRGATRLSTGDGNDTVIIDGSDPSYFDNIIELEEGDDTVTLNLAEVLQGRGYTMINGNEGNDTVRIDTAGLEEIVGEGNVDAVIAQIQADFDAWKATNPPAVKTFNVLDSIAPSGDPIEHGGTLYLGPCIETLEFYDSLLVESSGSDGIIS